MGAKCSLGENIEALWDSIEQGKLGINQIERFDVTGYQVNLGSVIKNEKDHKNDVDLLMSFGRQAAREAIQRARLTDLSGVSLAIGISNSILGEEINVIAKLIAEELGLGGTVFTVSTACASSAHAIGMGMDLIRSGKTEIILCGGVDLLNEDVFAGFYSLGLLSENACAPFSTKMGTTLGEGSAFIVLEKEATAINRGVKPIAVCRGFGHSADAYHDTSPDPKGLGMARAINSALMDAGVNAQQIDYINAHGTGTQANDAAEWRAIKRVFGEYAENLPVSSSKSFLGHTQGVAGVMEAAVSMMAMNRNKILPTQNLEQSRPYSPVDPVKGKYPRNHVVNSFVSTNAAFGGVNTALVFGQYLESEHRDNKAVKQIPIGISFSSSVGDIGEISKRVPISELRTMDKSALLLSSAIASLLTKQKIQPRSQACKEIGMFVGQSKVSPESLANFRKSIEVFGYRNLSPHAFTKMVVNYATGSTARIFGLKGPTVTISTEVDSGLAAMLFAANHMHCHPECKRLIAAGVDEVDTESTFKDNASAVILSKENNSDIYLTAWAISTQIDEAISSTLTNAGYSVSDVEYIEIKGKGSTAGLNIIDTILASKLKKYNKPILLSQQNSQNFAIALIIEKNTKNAS